MTRWAGAMVLGGATLAALIATPRLIRGQAPTQPPSGAPGIQMMDPRRDTGQSIAPVYEGGAQPGRYRACISAT
jgi:hypothetical protein